jgi:hypothetical protein
VEKAYWLLVEARRTVSIQHALVTQTEETLQQLERRKIYDVYRVQITRVDPASMSTEPRTCRFVAPIVRSVANSRVRWAIVIESEFAMTNDPRRARSANASRKVPGRR